MDEQTKEAELRERETPWPKTEDELLAVIRELRDMEHDYGTCVYAMSISAAATLNYMAGVLGTTGFQVSCADLDILRRTRHIKGPFGIIDSDNMLYPQYDITARVQEMLDGWRGWAAEEARKLLESSGGHAHPDVIRHWEELAAYNPA